MGNAICPFCGHQWMEDLQAQRDKGVKPENEKGLQELGWKFFGLGDWTCPKCANLVDKVITDTLAKVEEYKQKKRDIASLEKFMRNHGHWRF